MTLLQPIWLALLVPLVLALWAWRPPTRLLLALRALSLLLLLMSLCGLTLRLPSRVVAFRPHANDRSMTTVASAKPWAVSPSLN